MYAYAASVLLEDADMFVEEHKVNLELLINEILLKLQLQVKAQMSTFASLV
jgi:hypothetical protein